MILSLDQIIPWATHYKYWVIFPVAVIEGPIITVISGFLSSLARLNFIIAYFVLVAADLSGDALYYLLGRFGRQKTVMKIGYFFGITPQRVAALEEHFAKHPNKIFIAGKMAHGIGTVVLAAAGFVKVPFRKFILLNTVPTMVKTLILLAVGFYFGKAYLHINTYLDYTAIIIAIIFLALYIAIIKYSQKIIRS